MQLQTLPEAFKHAQPILETLEAGGYEAYFVGGSVRDTLLGRAPHDVDIATSAYPEEVKQLFKKTVDTGIEHGTVMVLDHGDGYEITTFRTESGYTDYRRPDKVKFVRNLSEDLKRRDFTINALALKADGTVIDMFDGLTDLKQHILRAVGDPSERFNEDALRMMRAVRFAAQLNFGIDSQTKQAIVKKRNLLAKISVERLNDEMTKLLQAPNAQLGLLMLIMLELNQYLPGLNQKDIDLWGYTEQLAVRQPQTATQAWTLMAFELGLTASDAGDFLRLWKHSNELIQMAQAALRVLNIARMDVPTDWDLYQAGPALVTAQAVGEISEMPMMGSDWNRRYERLPIHKRQELAINGQTLMQELKMPAGPKLGQILLKLEQAVVADQVANTKDALLTQAVKLDASPQA